MENLKFEIGEAEIGHNELLFAYTDGVVDARDMNNKPFTEERLLDEINSKAGAPEIVLKHIMSALHDHISDQDQYDDLTLLGLYRK
jgi:sigma-B regulation protein RsbU (phosphoserine phosphatase)